MIPLANVMLSPARSGTHEFPLVVKERSQVTLELGLTLE